MLYENDVSLIRDGKTRSQFLDGLGWFAGDGQSVTRRPLMQPS